MGKKKSAKISTDTKIANVRGPDWSRVVVKSTNFKEFIEVFMGALVGVVEDKKDSKNAIVCTAQIDRPRRGWIGSINVPDEGVGV